ncbi:NAD dependent epimerase/dehydratase [Aspergillus homomorphus CBS 101889]|uniref:NAD dependent epimerase/dehydratase n=1 Tax=Aspergillus homomorphus (strain CBS 101889) TaxID=1450537 RepID=A0A395HHJ9_ASPHC|nr:NAD dependent epimerase/dehydratase [Aspergillus homomorphus CBS 101889]RAL06969.1 NAD dependent epimerase/dehydratase [Aspergillus homomorphus CBS 101889]
MSTSYHELHVPLTGASGFVASHILSILLEVGKVHFVIVADFTSRTLFNTWFKDTKVPFDYDIHTASPLKFNIEDMQREMIEPAVQGTTQILQSALQHGGSTLKRFVLLGSAVSVTAQQAIERKDSVLGYNVSNTQVEKKAWDFMTEYKPQFDLTVINPDIITGPMIHPMEGRGSINETNYFAVASFIDETNPRVEEVLFPFYHFVDVRNVARSHVDALTNPAAAGQHILLVSGLITPQLVVNFIRKHFPNLRNNVLERMPAKELPEGVHPTGWDMRVSLAILSKGSGSEWRYIGLEDSVKDTVQSMIQRGVLTN